MAITCLLGLTLSLPEALHTLSLAMGFKHLSCFAFYYAVQSGYNQFDSGWNPDHSNESRK